MIMCEHIRRKKIKFATTRLEKGVAMGNDHLTETFINVILSYFKISIN